AALIHYFFFQAEDGIRDFHVTGVQTCALPISVPAHVPCPRSLGSTPASPAGADSSSSPVVPRPPTRRPARCPRSRTTRLLRTAQIGRASCRERVWPSGGAIS